MLIYVFLILVPLLLVCVFILGHRVFLKKDGTFPNTHVGRDKNMRDRGVGCATSQDREAQNESKYKIDVNNLNY